jgi:hypothetical protein
MPPIMIWLTCDISHPSVQAKTLYQAQPYRVIASIPTPSSERKKCMFTCSILLHLADFDNLFSYTLDTRCRDVQTNYSSLASF